MLRNQPSILSNLPTRALKRAGKQDGAIKTTLALAFLALGVVTSPAATLTQTSGDLIIGFRATATTTGDDKVYLLDIGQYSKFSSIAAGTTLTLDTANTPGLGNIFADLSAQYGGNSWQSSGNLNWSIVGYQGSNGPVLFASALQPSTPFPAISDASIRSGIRANIQAGIAGYNGGTSTANSNLGFFQSSSLANGWKDQVTAAGPDFGDQSQWTSVEGLTTAYLDLYRITGTTVNSPGSFAISSLGTITYTATSAVPEPSTYAFLAIGAVGLFYTVRRKKKQSTAQSATQPIA